MTQWDENTDVVVIGSGLAGLAAAIEARLAGARVVVLEKMNITGGNTRLSDGALSAPGNFLQKEHGVEDSPQLFIEDLMRAGLGQNHPGLVRTFAENACPAIDWTRELGVRYRPRLDRFGGHSAARGITTQSHSGVEIIKAQTARLRSLDVEIRTRCLLKNLVTDENNAVIGVQIQQGYRFPDENSGNPRTIRAERGVVLATGGFAGDTRFRSLFQPRLDKSFTTTNHRGATAEALVAALKIQALPVHLSHIQLAPWGCPDEKGFGRGARFASYSVFTEGILIDPKTGLRIVNEWADRRERSNAMIQAGHACLGIVDAVGAEKDRESLESGLRTGKIRAFDNIPGLARGFSTPPDALEKTIHDYNRLIQQGRRDEFGKPLTTSTAKIASPPFYAIRLWPKVHYTPGGVGINEKAQVLDLQGAPIPGLYAAGEVCGGVHGASRLGGCALTECLVFGRIAGQQAAG